MLIMATFLTEHVLYLIGIAGFCTILLFVTKTPLRVYLRNILFLSWLLIFTFLTTLWGNTPLEQSGTLLQEFSIGRLTLTYSRFFDGLFTIGQLIVVVGWVTILGSSSSPLELVNGIERLLRPLQLLGIPIQKLSLVTMLSLRFIPILFEEGQHLVHAYIARGIDLNSGNIAVRLKNFVLLCAPLFSNMIRRVEHLTLAMESRAFQVGAERSSLYPLRMKYPDYFILCVSFLILVLTVKSA